MLENRLLRGGGRLQEVDATRGSTVFIYFSIIPTLCYLDFFHLANCQSNVDRDVDPGSVLCEPSINLSVDKRYRGFAQQPCCMAGTMKMFCIRKNIFSHRKKNLLFLPCNMAAVQNFY